MILEYGITNASFIVCRGMGEGGGGFTTNMNMYGRLFRWCFAFFSAHLVNLTMLLPMVEMGAEAGPVTLL